jgi:hypothetical protein
VSARFLNGLAKTSFAMQDQELRFRLTIPIEDAFAFAMGEFDLGGNQATDGMRHLVGVLTIDSLEYAEHWRVAAEVRACLAERWPECSGFRPAASSDDGE